MPCPLPGDLPNLGIELRFPALQADCSPSEPPRRVFRKSSAPSVRASSGAGQVLGFVCLVGWFVGFFFFFFWLYWVFIAVCQLSQVVSSWGYSLAVVHELLIAVHSLGAEHRL